MAAEFHVEDCNDVFNALEQTRLKVLFDRMDSDHDGFINHEDLRRLTAEFGHEMQAERAAELIARADPEKLGRINWVNFCRAFARVLVKIKAAVMLVVAFKIMDVNNTGFITREDVRRLVTEYQIDITEARIDELILLCNPGADGRIAFKEFIAALVNKLRHM